METESPEIMDIYSEPGTKVVYLGINGYDGDRAIADKLLKKDTVYEVEFIEVGNSHSYVKLVGIPDDFNTVMFGPAGKLLVATALKVNKERTELYALTEDGDKMSFGNRVHLTNIEILSITSNINIYGLGTHRVRYLEKT